LDLRKLDVQQRGSVHRGARAQRRFGRTVLFRRGLHGVEPRLRYRDVRVAAGAPRLQRSSCGYVQQLSELRPALLLAAVLAVSCSGGGNPAGPSGAPNSAPAPPPAAPRLYAGPVTGEMTIRLTVVPTTSATNICVYRREFRGTLTLTLTGAPDGPVTGTGVTAGTETEVEITGPPLCTSTFGTAAFNWDRPLSGTPTELSFRGEAVRATVPGTVTSTIAFAGALRDGVVSGTLTVTDAQSLRNPHPQVSSVTGGGSASFPVTLR
jgi:hypothetical protein